MYVKKKFLFLKYVGFPFSKKERKGKKEKRERKEERYLFQGFNCLLSKYNKDLS